MRTLLLVFIVIFGQVAQAEDKVANNDIKLMQQALTELHPGYGRYGTIESLKKSYQSLLTFADTQPGTLQLFAEVQRHLSKLRCEHTVVELPKALRDQKRQRMSPFHLKAFDGKLYISHAKAPLARGDELVSVNGQTSADILNKLAEYVSYDGYTSHVVTDKIAKDYDVLGSYFEILFAPVVLGLNEYPESLDIVIRSQSDQQLREFTVQTIDLQSWQEISGEPYRLNFKDAVSVAYYGKTAVLKVDTFVNYRQPVDAKHIFEDLFKEFRAKNISYLIVDLRNNGGGSDDAQFALLTHLIKSPVKINTKAWIKGNSHAQWRDRLNTWDKSIFEIDYDALTPHPEGYELPGALMGMSYQTTQPAEFSFAGNIIMLSSRKNSSGSAAALGILAQQPHITTLGQKTGGNLGGTTASIITFLELPKSGIRVRVPLIRNVYNIENVRDGYGLTPDIEVEIELADWLAGRDSILENAIARANGMQ